MCISCRVRAQLALCILLIESGKSFICQLRYNLESAIIFPGEWPGSLSPGVGSRELVLFFYHLLGLAFKKACLPSCTPFAIQEHPFWIFLLLARSSPVGPCNAPSPGLEMGFPLEGWALKPSGFGLLRCTHLSDLEVKTGCNDGWSV